MTLSRVRHHRRGEHRVREQADVEHRVRCGELAEHEAGSSDDRHRKAQPEEEVRTRSQAVFDGEDERCEGEHRQDDGERVEATRVRVARFGQQNSGRRDEERDERQVDEEDRAPVEVLEQKTAEDRPQSGTTGEHRSPGGDRDATVLVMVEDIADERQRRGA
jgi:hypothetical protein